MLNEFSLRALQAHKQEVLNFIEVAKATGSRTAAKAAELVKRLEANIAMDLTNSGASLAVDRQVIAGVRRGDCCSDYVAS